MKRLDRVRGRRMDYGQRIHFIRRSISKCVNSEEGIWSVRVTKSYRAVGVLEGDTVTWFWIGSHDKYEKFFS